MFVSTLFSIHAVVDVTRMKDTVRAILRTSLTGNYSMIQR